MHHKKDMSKISSLALIVIALAIGYAFVYSPMGELNILLDQKQENENSLEMMRNIENKKTELLTQYNNIPEEDKKAINTVLPDSFDFVKLVYQIDTVAAKYGISIDGIISREVNTSVGNSVDSATPEQPYKANTIGFNFLADYDKFRIFMDELEKSLRILDIRSVKINVDSKSSIYKYSVEFQTYWLTSKMNEQSKK